MTSKVQKPNQEPNITIEYTDYAKEERFSNIFRFDYQNEHMKIEFGQLKKPQENEINLNVIASILIPKACIESFLAQAAAMTIDLVNKNEVVFEKLDLKGQINPNEGKENE
jgi:hypothetical protein